MRKGGVSPGPAAYNEALKACVEAGEWGHASTLLADVRASGGVPDAAGVSALKAALGASTGGGEGAAVVASAEVADLTSCDGWGGVIGVQAAGSPCTTVGGVGAESSWPSRRSPASAGRAFGSVAGESWRREALLNRGSGDGDVDEALESISLSSRWGDD